MTFNPRLPLLLSRCLAQISYNFKNGPWKHSYVKFGYDPRQTFESIDYQIIDISVNEKSENYYRDVNQKL